MTDGVELVGVEAVEVVFGDLTGVEQGREDEGQDGVAVVEGVADPAALAEQALQFPKF